MNHRKNVTFVEVGAALLRIRNGRRYRETHGTIEDYWPELEQDAIIDKALEIDVSTTTLRVKRPTTLVIAHSRGDGKSTPRGQGWPCPSRLRKGPDSR
jgi:hypothetical protein